MNTSIDAKWSALGAEVTRRGGDGEEFVTAMKELYTLWTPELYLWLAKLYDPRIGGFYFSNCARDNEPFLPDIESTNQATKLVQELGMIDSREEFPEEFKKKVGEFVLSCFDPEDGYFYHPQWGKNIIAARRGRDLMWASGMIREFLSITLPAPTATERLAVANNGNRSAAENLPDYLKSPEALREYLEGWNWETLAYPSGNNLAAIQNQIISAGLANTAIEFLNEIQNKETGLWGILKGYDAVNGYLKISSFYVAAGVIVPNCEKAAETIIECLCSDEDAKTMCYQYNVWFAIMNILIGLRGLGDAGKEAADRIAATVLRGAPAAIRKTREKIQAFEIGDGSYSAGLTHESSGQSQGAWVDIRGSVTGNINASIINSGEILDKIYGALELREFFVPVFGKEHFARFLEALPKE